MTFQSRRISEEREPRAASVPWERIAVGALKVLQPVVGIYRSWKRQHDEEEHHRARVRLLKKTAIVLTSILVSVMLIAGVVKALVSMRVLSMQTIFAVAGAELPQDENGFTNFLLLGRGDAHHDGTDLTDSMMIMSLDPRTKSVALLSIPRDLYVQSSETMGNGRINELYRNRKVWLQRNQDLPEADASRQAMADLQREAGRFFGVEIHYAAIIDFSGFVKAVDALGGVDVLVPEDLVDTEYPGPNYSYQTFRLAAGLQHLDGETALKYARSRHSTSDFGRSARQQQLLSAMAEKAKGEGILRSAGQITSLLRILSEHTETTMSAAEIIGAAEMAQDIDRSRILSAQLNVENGVDTSLVSMGGFLYFPPRDQFGGASVLLPLADASGDRWGQVRSFARFLLEHRAMLLARPSIAVRNASGKRGLAGSLGSELIRYGFDVPEIGNASIPKQDESVVLAATETDLPVATFFGTLLGLPARVAAAELPAEEMSQVTILIGRLYEYKPIHRLLSVEP